MTTLPNLKKDDTGFVGKLSFGPLSDRRAPRLGGSPEIRFNVQRRGPS